jgi:hypothetical protein
MKPLSQVWHAECSRHSQKTWSFTKCITRRARTRSCTTHPLRIRGDLLTLFCQNSFSKIRRCQLSLLRGSDVLRRRGNPPQTFLARMDIEHNNCEHYLRCTYQGYMLGASHSVRRLYKAVRTPGSSRRIDLQYCPALRSPQYYRSRSDRPHSYDQLPLPSPLPSLV